MTTSPEARTTPTKIATLTEVRTANVAIQAVALEAEAAADPVLVQSHEIARGPGRALQHVVAGQEAVIQDHDQGQDPEVEAAEVLIGHLMTTMQKMDTGFTWLIWTAMLENGTLKSFLASTDP